MYVFIREDCGKLCLEQDPTVLMFGSASRMLMSVMSSNGVEGTGAGDASKASSECLGEVYWSRSCLFELFTFAVA